MLNSLVNIKFNLESYKSVTLENMASAFGVSPRFIDLYIILKLK